METLLLTDQMKRRKPTLLRLPIRVPPGYELPEGETVIDGFDITVEAGVRWHPEWTEPRITVNAFRFFSHGDCLCWSGEFVNGLPVPKEIEALAPFHGQPLAEESRAMIDAMGLDIPSKQEGYGAFIARPEPRVIH